MTNSPRTDTMLNVNVQRLIGELRANRRLQAGIAVVLAIALAEFALRWSDHIQEQERQLAQLQGDLHALRTQSRVESELVAQRDALAAAHRTIEDRLWNAPSEAIAQARFRDWLAEALLSAGARNSTVSLAPPRPPGERRDQSIANNAKNPQPTEGLRELRGTIAFAFSPETLEKTLLTIEGGEALARVESIQVTRRTQRAELTVRLLARIAPQTTPRDRPASAPLTTQ